MKLPVSVCSYLNAMYADVSMTANFSKPTWVAVVALWATNSFLRCQIVVKYINMFFLLEACTWM